MTIAILLLVPFVGGIVTTVLGPANSGESTSPYYSVVLAFIAMQILAYVCAVVWCAVHTRWGLLLLMLGEGVLLMAWIGVLVEAYFRFGSSTSI